MKLGTCVAIAAACAIPRILYLAAAPPHGFNYYWFLSTSLLRDGTLGLHGTETTQFWPGYPLFLALARWVAHDNVTRVLLLQIGVCTIGAIYLYKLALALTDNVAVARITTAWFCMYPYLVRQAASFMAISLFTTLLVAATFHYVRITSWRDAAKSGLAFGLTIVTYTMSLPIWLLATVALAIRQSAGRAGVMAAAALLVLAPVVSRNYRLDGSVLPTRSGLNLIVGNSEYSDKLIPEHDLDLLAVAIEEDLLSYVDPNAPGLDRALDIEMTRRALAFMKAQPFRTLRLKLLNILYTFHPRIIPFYPMGEDTTLALESDGRFQIENPRSRGLVAELAHTLTYSMMATTALVGMFLRRRQWRDDLILYVIVLSFAAVCSAYFPTTRLRVPMDFVLMFFSGCAIEAIWRRASATFQLNR